MDSNEVYDQEQDQRPPSPVEEISAYVTRVMDADRWLAQAAYYAWGRLDGGEEPVVGDAGTTVYQFAVAWQSMMLAFRDGKRTSAVSVPAAWENYRVTGGVSVEYPMSSAEAQMLLRSGRHGDVTVSRQVW